MTDEAKAASDDKAADPIGGARLAAARVSHDISARDIAKELHLDEPTVLAIEQNNFELLGAPVFAKGHLRKYAELVGVPVEDVIADYYQMTRSEGLQPVVTRSTALGRSISPGPWIAATIAVLVMAGAGYWWFQREPAPVVEVPDTATLAPFATDRPATPPAEAAQPVAETTGEAESEPQAQATDAASVALDESSGEPAPVLDAIEEPSVDASAAEVSQSEPAGAEPPVASDTELATAPDSGASMLPQTVVRISFSADCWTEVVDANGRRLFYDLGTAGRVANLSGVAPFRVILGDSGSVKMTVDGRDYPVPEPARSGGLTRLTVNSQ